MKMKADSNSFIHLCSKELRKSLRRRTVNSESEKDILMVEKVDGAIWQAAEKILQRAKQTHTSLVIWEDNQIKEVPPETLEMRISASLSLEASA